MIKMYLYLSLEEVRYVRWLQQPFLSGAWLLDGEELRRATAIGGRV